MSTSNQTPRSRPNADGGRLILHPTRDRTGHMPSDVPPAKRMPASAPATPRPGEADGDIEEDGYGYGV